MAFILDLQGLEAPAPTEAAAVPSRILSIIPPGPCI
jgi:hypothetical protein